MLILYLFKGHNQFEYKHLYYFMFELFYVPRCQHDNGYTVDHILRSTPMNGHRFTALGLPRWSPIQVLTEVDIV